MGALASEGSAGKGGRRSSCQGLAQRPRRQCRVSSDGDLGMWGSAAPPAGARGFSRGRLVGPEVVLSRKRFLLIHCVLPSEPAVWVTTVSTVLGWC